MEEASLSEYLHIANKYFVEEKERFESYLYWEIKDKITHAFREEMLVKNQITLLERDSGLKYLLVQDKFEELELLYSLYSDI